ncbi:UDP-N-acetylmuramoylalanine--D-glutamate ligase [Sporomusaceae bacterium BoRhaA]|uniref:UDP-N-acetylmuramoyl-L-alanine--D-glutamate ligase n=1 Tax=Pelorhabdus rhamnosifermentans TaxID=2772457 RepID=UPI001C05F57F|nr:UDP-N-acetylmuramoyl-L-alanine--D-glutamate ligase [Pelorhabdus rhamnosifermentans]MBU2702990.1 UDP-N-acetylmuramoylalanine--D-glutamate ligase [Pelorhabdus rhamnosifermentans]
MQFNGKKVIVLGSGISGISVALVLKNLGAYVTLSDNKPLNQLKKDPSFLLEKGIKLALGNQEAALLDGVDYVILSPGVSIYTDFVQQALAKNILVMSEVEVAYQLCPAPIVAITGTNGKTTTTTLIGEMIACHNKEVVVGGNIGQALSDEVKDITDKGIVVAEISSFQMESARDFKPHIAAVLNITPDHIDRHKTFENYVAMKERVFAKQTSDDFLVLNYDDPTLRPMADRAKSQVLFFSRKETLQQGAYIKKDQIWISWKDQELPVCPVSVMKIPGAHNVENALAAAAVSFLAGVAITDIAKVLENFEGVEHRIEPVTTLHGVPYYNDSKATNPESSIKALEAFAGHIVLIAGGRDKNTDLTEMMLLIKEKVDHLILLGEASARFKEAALLHEIANIHEAKTFADAVNLAYKIATPPHIVLLSPACASYDMFKSYEERGTVFKKLVRLLS